MKKLGELHKEIEMESEVARVVNALLACAEENMVPAEDHSGWYCGVTGQETSDDEFELERIGQHYDGDFPALDEESICKEPVSSPKVATEVERIMRDDHGFDAGERISQPTDENQVWTYIFRKKA